MADKVTVMVLKVDLQCPCCYKKIKKILCKFPQIRDQVFDEKANTVTITVVCCSPEKIRDKLCCKGSKVIKSIEIKDPPKPKPPAPEKPVEKPKEAPKPDPPKLPTPEKPKEAPKPDPPKPPAPEKPKETPKPDPPKPPAPEKPKEAPKPDPPKPPAPDPNPPPVRVFEPCHVDGFPPHFPPRTCCGPCSAGYGGGPCYHGYGVPPPPQPCYDGYYGYGYGQSRSCPVSRCEYYFNEENPQSCTIM